MSVPRVLSLPREHEFVHRALPRQAVVPAPMSPAQARGWEPSPAFTERWLVQNRRSFDLVHLHFGFEAIALPALRDWLEALRRLRLPLVFTVHDLRNPHQTQAEAYASQLDILLAAAAQVVTLTGGAAREICARFGREADVIPHPPLLARAQRRLRTGVVGISLKARAQVVEADELVMAALRGVEAARALRPDASLRITAHPDVFGDLSETRSAAESGRLTLDVLTRLSDAEFHRTLSGLEAAVLPYRFGTHSGWLEACRDVGTRVIAPDCGYYDEQWDEVLTFGSNESTGFDADSLTIATQRALLAAPLGSAPPQEPRLERSRGSYAAVYDRALMGST